MAQSFWSKRKQDIQSAGSYVNDTNSVSRPMAALLTVAGILIVGGLLFGIFAGTKWVITELTDDNTSNVATIDDGNDNIPVNTPGTTTTPTPATQPTPTTTSTTTPSPSITATSSASTNIPSTPAVKTVPNTGPRENYLMIFLATSIVAYFIYRKKLLKD